MSTVQPPYGVPDTTSSDDTSSATGTGSTDGSGSSGTTSG